MQKGGKKKNYLNIKYYSNLFLTGHASLISFQQEDFVCVDIQLH